MTALRIIFAKLAALVVALYIFVAVAAIRATGDVFYILQLAAAVYVARLVYRRIRNRLAGRSDPHGGHHADNTHAS